MKLSKANRVTRLYKEFRFFEDKVRWTKYNVDIGKLGYIDLYMHFDICLSETKRKIRKVKGKIR